ncbi:unnamed protein product, partial [Prorocentrum cordatum]
MQSAVLAAFIITGAVRFFMPVSTIALNKPIFRPRGVPFLDAFNRRAERAQAQGYLQSQSCGHQFIAVLAAISSEAKVLVQATARTRHLEHETGVDRRNGSDLHRTVLAQGLVPQSVADEFMQWNETGDTARHKKWFQTDKKQARKAWADSIDEILSKVNDVVPRVDAMRLGSHSRRAGSCGPSGSDPAPSTDMALDSIVQLIEQRILDKLDAKFHAGFALLSYSYTKQLPALFTRAIQPVTETLQSQVAKEVNNMRSETAASYNTRMVPTKICHAADEAHAAAVAARRVVEEARCRLHAPVEAGMKPAKLQLQGDDMRGGIVDTVDQRLQDIDRDTDEMQQHIDLPEQHVQHLQGHEQYFDNRDGSGHFDSYFGTLLKHIRHDDCCNAFARILNPPAVPLLLVAGTLAIAVHLHQKPPSIESDELQQQIGHAGPTHGSHDAPGLFGSNFDDLFARIQRADCCDGLAKVLDPLGLSMPPPGLFEKTQQTAAAAVPMRSEPDALQT